MGGPHVEMRLLYRTSTFYLLIHICWHSYSRGSHVNWKANKVKWISVLFYYTRWHSRLKTQKYLFDHYLHFLKLHIISNYMYSLFIYGQGDFHWNHMWSLAWEPPLWKRKYMYTNSESIPCYFKYLEYSYLNVTFWPIMGDTVRIFLIQYQYWYLNNDTNTFTTKCQLIL